MSGRIDNKQYKGLWSTTSTHNLSACTNQLFFRVSTLLALHTACGKENFGWKFYVIKFFLILKLFEIFFFSLIMHASDYEYLEIEDFCFFFEEIFFLNGLGEVFVYYKIYSKYVQILIYNSTRICSNPRKSPFKCTLAFKIINIINYFKSKNWKSKPPDIFLSGVVVKMPVTLSTPLMVLSSFRYSQSKLAHHSPLNFLDKS